MIAHKWEMVPGRLWQADIYGATTTDADVVVSCSMLSSLPSTAADWFWRRPMHLFCPFHDRASLPDINLIDIAVELAIEAMGANKTVVVNCDLGKNRSGLVIGLILVEMGYAGVVDYIRKVNPGSLSNETFADYVRGREAIGRPRDATETLRGGDSLAGG